MTIIMIVMIQCLDDISDSVVFLSDFLSNALGWVNIIFMIMLMKMAVVKMVMMMMVMMMVIFSLQDYDAYTELEIHAELVYAECLLLKVSPSQS